MKRSIYFIVFLIIFTVLPNCVSAFQKTLIQNHSFAVITEDYPSPKKEAGYARTSVFIKNDNCNIQYKATFGKHALGEGSIEVKVSPYIVRLGNNTLKITCSTLKEITVEDIE